MTNFTFPCNKTKLSCTLFFNLCDNKFTLSTQFLENWAKSYNNLGLLIDWLTCRRSFAISIRFVFTLCFPPMPMTASSKALVCPACLCDLAYKRTLATCHIRVGHCVYDLRCPIYVAETLGNGTNTQKIEFYLVSRDIDAQQYWSGPYWWLTDGDNTAFQSYR